VVILLKFGFLLFLSQGHARLVAAGEACDHYVRLSFVFYSYAAVFAGHKQGVAVSADSALVFSRQAYSCGHGYFSGGLHVAAGELRVFSAGFFGLLEENFYAVFGYPLCSGVHF
jgi:hypothetical protein